MKTKFYICILLFLLVCNCFSFTNKKGSCLLLPQNKIVCLTDDYDNVVDSIINDSVNDHFPLISIYDVRDGKAFVNAEFIDDSTKHIGWIDIDNLGIFLIPDTGNIIKLHKKPIKESIVVDSIINPCWGDYYHFKDCNEGWLFISEKKKEGWVAPENQCDNPYTVCN